MEAAIVAMDDSPALIERALEECRAKQVDLDTLRARLATFRERWPALKERLERQLRSTGKLRELLVAGGCPVEPEQLGLTLSQVRASYVPAWRIRRRYTVYDLAYELGVFEDLIGEVFAPGGYWADQPAAVS
jgi:glycerol-1-phosphate dehydrogenase [NAD(P)+]